MVLVIRGEKLSVSHQSAVLLITRNALTFQNQMIPGNATLTNVEDSFGKPHHGQRLVLHFLRPSVSKIDILISNFKLINY